MEHTAKNTAINLKSVLKWCIINIDYVFIKEKYVRPNFDTTKRGGQDKYEGKISVC